MGFTGQLFATRIAIGLAVPSPQALAKTGGLLAKGIQNIHAQIGQAQRAAAGNLGAYQSDLNKLNTITTSTAQKLNNEINVSLKRSLSQMDAVTNKALSRSFSKTQSGYEKLKKVLAAPLRNQLMSGMGGLEGIDAMIQQTQNLHNMGKANRQEIITAQEQIVAASERRLDLANEEMSKFGEINEANAKAAEKAAEEVMLAQAELEVDKKVLDNLRLQNKEIESKVGTMQRFNLQSQKFKENILGAYDALRNKFNSALRTSAMLITAVGYKLSQNVNELMEYERELLNANSVFNLTNSNLFDVSQSILEFGNNFGIATQNAASGLYQLASAGVSANEAMEILPHTLKLSMAVQGDHNTISKLTAQTLFGFGMEMDQAAELTDKFAFAIQKSLIEYQDLSSAVKFALPFFTSTGQSIDQLLGALQILTNRALEAGIAGRGLRQALAEFAESALDAEVGFRQMGVEILNAEGEMLQLTEIAAQFADAVGPETASNTELLTTLIEDLNVRGATAFIHLVQASDEFTQAVQDTENAGGQLDEMVRIQNASLTAQVQILKTNIMSIFAFRDAAYEGTEFLNGFHEAVHNLVDGFKNQIIAVEDGEQVLTEFGQQLQNMATGALKSFADLFERVVEAFKALAEHEETFVQLFDIMVKFFEVLSDGIIWASKTGVPGLNMSLLELLATLKLISMFGGGMLAKGIGVAGKYALSAGRGLMGLARAGGAAKALNTAGAAARGWGLKTTLGAGSRGGLLKAGMKWGARGLLAGTGIGTALLAYEALKFVDDKGIVDVPLMAGGGYTKPMAGGGYLVGEQGPELFIPGQAGQVLNNAETNNMLGKDAVFRNATISVDSFGGLY